MKYERLTLNMDLVKIEEAAKNLPFWPQGETIKLWGRNIFEYFKRLQELEDKIENGTLIELQDKEKCSSYATAKNIYDAGYRKEIQAEWVWKERFGRTSLGCSNCDCHYIGDNAELIVASQKYCPNCGAKMKQYGNNVWVEMIIKNEE